MLKHPLLVLIVGAILTSIVVPRITEMATRSRLREEQRQKTAIAILQNSSKTERLVNAAVTTLEQFEKDIAGHHLTGSALAERQAELEKRSRELYDQINDLAWWWLLDAFNEGEVTHSISPAGLKQFRAQIERYNSLMAETGKRFFMRRDGLLAPGYRPPGDGAVDADIAAFRGTLDLLRDQRSGIAGKICDIVMETR